MGTAIADKEPTFDLPSGGSSDFYFTREVNDRESTNNGKVIRKHGLRRYPFLTRRTGDSLAGTNEEMASSELRHGRTPGKTKLGNASSSGGLDFEFSPETFDDNLEGVFRDQWIRWKHDGQKDGIAKDFATPAGHMYVNGDPGTYNQWYDSTREGKRENDIPVFYTGDEAGTRADPFGLVKVSAEKLGNRANNPLGKFIAHELHIGNTPVKYSALSRIPITDKTVRYQNYRHVEMGELNLSVTVNSIVTGSFQMNGSDNPDYFTENQETGKKRMADEMKDKKSVATGTGDEFFGSDFRDAAERFVAAARNTVKSTDTDQFTALDGFLYVNGHQLQFCSDLTLDLNNNLQAINAIFVKNAIANLAPTLAVTGNFTAYFTDGEMDATGMKFGADDLKNLASQNKDVEIVFAFIDKEDPDVVYLFQVFKSTVSSPTESKGADQPITLDLSYTSYGEKAVRVLRFAIPKVRDIIIDTDTAVSSIRDGSSVTTLGVNVIPNVPLDKNAPAVSSGVFSDKDYVDSYNTNGLYVFNGAEVTVIAADGTSTVDTGAVFSGAQIEDDGSISATLTLSSALAEGKTVKIKLHVNGDDYEESNTIEPYIPYMRMGDSYKADMYENGHVEVKQDTTLNVLTAVDEALTPDDEDYLLFKSYEDMDADDLKVTVDDTTGVSVSGAVITVADTVAVNTEFNVHVESVYDANVSMDFKVKVVAGE